ncbi:MAG: hypothetical protein AAF629_20140 [Chloroflexota bacterium]
MSSHLSGSYEELATQAQQHMRNNQYAEAKDIYERVYNRLGKMKDSLLEKRPRLRELQVMSTRMLADLSSFDGEHDQAIEYYTTALNIDPDQKLEYQRGIAQMKIDKGEANTGLDELRAIAFTNAGEPDPWIWLSVELWTQGNNGEAIENLERVVSMTGVESRSQSAAYTYLHDIYREEERIEDAADAWQKAWQVVDSEIDDVSPLYQMYFEVGNLEEANRWLKDEKNPLRAGFYKGLFAQADGSDKAEKSAWRKTASLNPLDQQDGHEAWAESALRINFAPDRIAYTLREVAGQNLINIRGTILLAIAFARMGQAEPADFALQQAIDISQRARPRRDQLSLGHWELFDELVADDAIKEQVRGYFETESDEGNDDEGDVVDEDAASEEASNEAG